MDNLQPTNEAANGRSDSTEVLGFGCHCELDEGMAPDDCVIYSGRISDCVHAEELVRNGKGRNDCEHWKRIVMVPNAQVRGGAHNGQNEG